VAISPDNHWLVTGSEDNTMLPLGEIESQPPAAFVDSNAIAKPPSTSSPL
jgi:hypothetical protein